MKALYVHMTCFSYPSQWRAKLEDGRMLYARYRWNNLTMQVSHSPTDDMLDVYDGITIFDQDQKLDSDGEMSTEQLQDITKDIIDWSECRTIWG